MKNTKLTDYFLGEQRNLLYTILGFQKRTLNYGGDTLTPTYVSYFLAYNHMRCRLEVYLINLGYPYHVYKDGSLKAKATHMLKHLIVGDDKTITAPEGSLVTNHFTIMGASEETFVGRPLDDITSEVLQISDGLLTLNFFKIFFTLLMFNSKNLNNYKTPHDIYDLREILYYRTNDPTKLEEYKIPAQKTISLLDPERVDEGMPFVINTQKRFVHNKFTREINNIINNTGQTEFQLNSIEKCQEAPCIKELRRILTAKAFVDNETLDQRIRFFNDSMIRKFIGRYLFPISLLLLLALILICISCLILIFRLLKDL